MADKTPQDTTKTTPSKPTAFSKCGCLKGELYGGTITLTTINKACDHQMEDTDIPLAAAKDVAHILAALGRQ